MNRGEKLPLYCHILAVCCASIVAALAVALPADDPEDTRRLEPPDVHDIPLPLPDAAESVLSGSGAPQGNFDADDWHTTVVKPGDSLSVIFSRLGLTTEDLYALISCCEEVRTLEQLIPGQIFKVRVDPAGQLLELIYEADDIHGTRMVRSADSFEVSQYNHKVEKRTAFSAGVITNSLYQSALEAGLSDRLIMQLAEIFGWDIDFALDIRPGDSFTVVYEEDYYAGERLGIGDILAAEFINQGKSYRAVRYVDPHGTAHYYTPEGRSMRQAFLRSPVDFRRISSHFQRQRWHPVLGTRRPHRGVDYAAATGTPIQASGDGQVVFIGKKGGYGNTVVLQHGKRYTTLYGHMSRFAGGVRKGSRVRQGDIIGYVGMSGLATGPHLHYEFRVDGVHKDPITVKLPGPPPIEPRFLADFRKRAVVLSTKLDLFKRTLLAMNTSR